MDNDLNEIIGSDKVVLFYSPGCSYCQRASEALASHGIVFKKVLIERYRPTLMQCTGRSSAPSVWIMGTYVGGCDDGMESWMGTLPMLKRGTFQKMLKGSWWPVSHDGPSQGAKSPHGCEYC